MGMRRPCRPLAVLTPRYGCRGARPHIRMPTLILSTLALFGCAFMVYVFFHWLRDELNTKRPLKRNRQSHIRDQRRPNVIRKA